jgi:hypothetical protein
MRSICGAFAGEWDVEVGGWVIQRVGNAPRSAKREALRVKGEEKVEVVRWCDGAVVQVVRVVRCPAWAAQVKGKVARHEQGEDAGRVTGYGGGGRGRVREARGEGAAGGAKARRAEGEEEGM